MIAEKLGVGVAFYRLFFLDGAEHIERSHEF
jgi:hypothetical protein